MNAPTPPTPFTADALETWKGWIGRSETVTDVVTARLIDGLTATLESERLFPSRQGQVPSALHWCLAPAIAPMAALGPDGHPARGGFLPPIPLPRRMWAGGQLTFSDALREGDIAQRVSTITDISLKQGRTGPLCFVKVEHAISTPRGLAVREIQDIVYREAASGDGAAAAAPSAVTPSAVAPSASAPSASDNRAADHALETDANAVKLFRYSALTFNGHRIHYDQPYTTGQEGYPGLIVHGPLQATLLVEYAAHLQGGISPRQFTFRGTHPLFDHEAFILKARHTQTGIDLWIETASGVTTMTATATWAP